MRIEELILNQDELAGIQAISLVENPAIELDFIALSKNRNITLSKIDEEKKMIIGPAIVPNKMILRFDENTNEEYYIYFTKETIENCALNYMKDNFNKYTVDHEKKIEDLYLIESWIVKNPKNDKINELGYIVPEGTWVVGLKINNDDIWNRIKNKEIKGFSIEGLFSAKNQKMAQKHSKTDAIDIIKEIYSSNISDDEKIKKIKNIIK